VATLNLHQDVDLLTADLVDIFSESGHETEVADAVATALATVPWLEVDRDGDAVVARTNHGRAERVVLAGHLDTVPAADNFPSTRDEDTLFGLGSADMKSGDAVMLRFSEVDDALRAVRELKRDFADHVRAIEMEPLLIHAGLHYGEVVIAPSGDVFGSTVNLAARLLGAAGTDDIVASRAAIERASGAGAAEFIGEKKFKNVEQPVGCFRVSAAMA